MSNALKHAFAAATPVAVCPAWGWTRRGTAWRGVARRGVAWRNMTLCDRSPTCPHPWPASQSRIVAIRRCNVFQRLARRGNRRANVFTQFSRHQSKGRPDRRPQNRTLFLHVSRKKNILIDILHHLAPPRSPSTLPRVRERVRCVTGRGGRDACGHSDGHWSWRLRSLQSGHLAQRCGDQQTDAERRFRRSVSLSHLHGTRVRERQSDGSQSAHARSGQLGVSSTDGARPTLTATRLTAVERRRGGR